MAAILRNRYDVIFPQSVLRCGRNSVISRLIQNNMQITAKWSRSEVETGSRITKWRTLVFLKTEVVISQPSLRYVDEIWFADRFCPPSEGSDINKYETGSTIKGRFRYLAKWIWHHISAAGGPIWMKFSSIVQNSMRIVWYDRNRNWNRK